VTVQPVAGFYGTVNTTCGALPAVTACSASPIVVPLPHSLLLPQPAVSTSLTLTTNGTTPPGIYSIPVTSATSTLRFVARALHTGVALAKCGFCT